MNEPINYVDIYSAYSHPNKTLYNHAKEIIYLSEELRNLGFDFEERYLKILAIFHDLGKTLIEWQNYLKGKNNINIKHSGPSSVLFFIIANNKNDNLIKNLKLNKIIEEFDINLNLSEEEIKILTYLILVHHSDLKLLRKGENTGNHYENFFTNFNPWEKILTKYNLLEEYEDSVTDKIKSNNVEKYLNSYAAFKISDKLSGSFHRNLEIDEIPKILYGLGVTNIKFSIDESKLKDLLKLISNSVYEDRLKDQIEFLNRKINILLAPTGFGKTTLSIFKGIGFSQRFLIALPTITAIKQFLHRTEKIVANIGYFNNIIGTYFYFYNPFSSSDEEINLNEYFLSRYLLKPIMITTVDQLLLTYLQTKDYFIKKFSLQNRLLIIDEVHLLSPKMLYFLLQFLKENRNIFNDYIFMSATFPEFLREIIKEELQIEKDHVMLLYSYYPKNRIYIELLNEEFEIRKDKKYKLFEEIYEKIKTLSNNNNPKIIVLFNTVNNAQEFYNFLKGKNIDWHICLFHSRFIYKHREKKEKTILKIEKKKRLLKPFILVATQVVEVSLDIDFDYLFTELAPLPELIQRFGRVYRNRKNTSLSNPNIYIFGFMEESKKVYNEELVKISWKIIKDFTGIVDEEKLVGLLDINSEYKESFMKEYEEANKEYSELVEKWLNKLSNRFYYLFYEDDERNIEEISKLLNIRNSINVLAFVNEEDLNEEDKEEYTSLMENLKESIKERNFEEFFRAKLSLREFTISLPFYYIYRVLPKKDEDIPRLPPGIYNEETGINLKKLSEYVREDIICKN